MRVFIAVEINEEVRGRIAQAQQGLRAVGGIKWVEPENFHLTLKFLGEVELGLVSRLANDLGAVAASCAGFDMVFRGAGVFPNEHRPRVVWMGIEEGLKQLFALALKVEEVCQALGFAAEHRPFSAHLTLGRAREAGAMLPALAAGLKALEGKSFGQTPVNYITIMESTLTRTGPIYRPLHKLQLKGI